MTERLTEIRIALVLYGGVSLAVYENGVVRCFYDLVKKRGIYGPLLEILEADATVDVVAGTSAGGINGLMLGAALENGTDFATTADLWRKDSDFDRLLRNIGEADEAVSLLDGDYYQLRLVDAFKKLCTKRDSEYESPGEMDIFITATDLDGRIQTYWDDLNQEICDKSHRTVFHLKHRPGRKSLGMAAQKESDRDDENQAWIFASIARITGTFPIAFPPFCLDQIPLNFKAAVQEALAKTSERTDNLDDKNSFIDGGVLDNKPFGHAIRAIFYRMPAKIVRRHLFYVEPDPKPLPSEKEELDPKKHTPFNVLKSALATIPSHESIYDDLEQLKKHNERIAWINRLTEEMQESSNPEGNADNALYRATRIESLARALLLESDIAPSAEDQIADKKRMDLMKPIRKRLKDTIAKNPDQFDALDVDFQLRRIFRMLYQYYSAFESNSRNKDARTLMQLLGRIIKALKLVRDMTIQARTKIIKYCIDNAENEEMASKLIYFAFYNFFDAEAEHWNKLFPHLEEAFDKYAYVDAPEDERKQLIPSFILSDTLAAFERTMDDRNTDQKQASHSAAFPKRLADKALAIYTEIDGSAADQGQPLHSAKIFRQFVDTTSETVERGDGPDSAREAPLRSKTILGCLADKTREIVKAIDGSEERFDRATAMDQRLYSLQFSANVHELDRIRLTRISPRDAQKGLSSGMLESKVTGEDFFHFSAFLRRDWRSNDILRGRIDGNCQIISSLLDPKTMERIRKSQKNYNHLFGKGSLKNFLPQCPSEFIDDAETKWKKLQAVWSEQKSSQPIEGERCFIDALIKATQYNAFMEDIESVSSDMIYQEMVWGRDKSAHGFPQDPEQNYIKHIEKKIAKLYGKKEPDTDDQCIAKIITRLHGRIDPDSNEKNIEQAASTIAKLHMETAEPTKLWDWFKEIGSQTVVGKNGVVPYHVLGEFLTKAYLLLYGLLGQSLGKRRYFLQEKRIRHAFRTPVRILHEIVTMMRGQFQSAALCTAAIISAALGILIMSIYNETRIWLAAALFILLFAVLLRYITPNAKKRAVWKVITIAVTSIIITHGIANYAILYGMPFLRDKVMPFVDKIRDYLAAAF